MGPEILITAASYGLAAIVALGLVVAAIVRRTRRAAFVTAGVSLAAGVAGGITSPEPWILHGAIFFFAVSGALIGSVASIVHLIQWWSDRRRTADIAG